MAINLGKKLKQLLSIFLMFACLLAIFYQPLAAKADDPNFTIVNGVLTKYNGGGGNVIIPYGVTSIGSLAFARNSDITGVTIPNSVTNIGDRAFFGCSGLTNVMIPGNVTNIGVAAFSGCSSLTNVTIPDNVTNIGDAAFKDCSSLTGVTIPNSFTSIGESMFWGCSSLTSFAISNNVKSIGNTAFACCGFTSVTIPNSVTSIGSLAFVDCEKLTSAYFEGNAPTFDSLAFYQASSTFKVYYNVDATGFNLSNGTWNSYTAQEYCNLKFDSQGGSGVQPQFVDYGGNAVVPANPANSNLGFDGWYKEAACNNMWNFSVDKVTANTTLYAKWSTSPSTYKVIFDKNNGDSGAAPATATTTYNCTVSLPAQNPGRAGYTFAGWNTKADGSGTTFDSTTRVTASITVYAQWTQDHYTVNFDKNNGESGAAPATATTTYNCTVTLPTQNPGHAGYTFAGWNTKADSSGTTFDSTTRVTASITVYAQFTQERYTVTFDTNNGDTDSDPATATTTYNCTVTLPTHNPGRVGYAFAGWNTKADGSGTTFDSTTNVTDNMKVYAQWTKKRFTVTFNRNGGNTAPSPVKTTAAYLDSVKLPKIKPTRLGYTFSGWNNKKDGSGTTFDSKSKVTGNVTLYAQWTHCSYTVSFNKNGGQTASNPANAVTVYKSTVNLPKKVPTRFGYIFTGWNTKANGKGKTFTASTKVIGNITVYAQWRKTGWYFK